jgi:tellurium resistance protein TerD
MALLKRGTNVALTREIPSLSRLTLGVHWNAGAETVLDHNLVMVTLLCDAANRALSEEHFVFFNQLSSPEESVVQAQQALGGDQEQVTVELAAVPDQVERLVVAVYVNEGPGQRRTLSQLKTCSIRVLNADDGQELVKSEELATGLSNETSLTLGELYRNQGGWKFKVLGQGYAGGVTALAKDFGLAV